jgi:predicted dehydrogenase
MENILKMKIGFIGAGSIARAHIMAAEAAGFTPIAICARDGSENARKLSKEFEDLRFFQSYEDFIKADFDCVSILLNTDVSVGMYSKVLSDRDIPVFIEKPVARESSIFTGNLNLDREKTLVGYNRRFYSSINEIRFLLAENKNVQSNWNIPEVSWEKKPISSVRKHFLLENSVHILDLFLFLLGTPSESKFMNYYQNEFLQHSTSLHQFSNGNIATLSINFGIPDNTFASFYLPGVNYLLKPIEILSKFSKIVTEPASEIVPYKKYVPTQDEVWEISKYDLLFKPGFYEQYLEFMRICMGAKRTIGATLRDAYNVIKFAEQIINSEIS